MAIKIEKLKINGEYIFPASVATAVKQNAVPNNSKDYGVTIGSIIGQPAEEGKNIEATGLYKAIEDAKLKLIDGEKALSFDTDGKLQSGFSLKLQKDWTPKGETTAIGTAIVLYGTSEDADHEVAYLDAADFVRDAFIKKVVLINDETAASANDPEYAAGTTTPFDWTKKENYPYILFTIESADGDTGKVTNYIRLVVNDLIDLYDGDNLVLSDKYADLADDAEYDPTTIKVGAKLDTIAAQVKKGLSTCGVQSVGGSKGAITLSKNAATPANGYEVVLSVEDAATKDGNIVAAVQTATIASQATTGAANGVVKADDAYTFCITAEATTSEADDVWA